MKPALALFLTILPAPAMAGVDYNRGPGGDVYGSDGSRAHTFAGTTTITRPGRKAVRCRTFAGTTRCD